MEYCFQWAKKVSCELFDLLSAKPATFVHRYGYISCVAFYYTTFDVFSPIDFSLSDFWCIFLDSEHKSLAQFHSYSAFRFELRYYRTVKNFKLFDPASYFGNFFGTKNFKTWNWYEKRQSILRNCFSTSCLKTIFEREVSSIVCFFIFATVVLSLRVRLSFLMVLRFS